MGEELFHNHFNVEEKCSTFDEIFEKIYKTEPTTIKEKEMYVKDFFFRTSGSYNYSLGTKYCWTLNNLDFEKIEKLKRYSDEVWNEKVLFMSSESQVMFIELLQERRKGLKSEKNFIRKIRKKEFLVHFKWTIRE